MEQTLEENIFKTIKTALDTHEVYSPIIEYIVLDTQDTDYLKIDVITNLENQADKRNPATIVPTIQNTYKALGTEVDIHVYSQNDYVNHLMKNNPYSYIHNVLTKDGKYSSHVQDLLINHNKQNPEQIDITYMLNKGVSRNDARIVDEYIQTVADDMYSKAKIETQVQRVKSRKFNKLKRSPV